MFGKKGKSIVLSVGRVDSRNSLSNRIETNKNETMYVTDTREKRTANVVWKLRLSSVDLVYDSIECTYMKLFYHNKAQAKLNYFNLFELQ